MLFFHVHVFVKRLTAVCFICIVAWLFTALEIRLTKDCLHAQRSRLVIDNKLLSPFVWSCFCFFGIFCAEKSLYKLCNTEIVVCDWNSFFVGLFSFPSPNETKVPSRALFKNIFVTKTCRNSRKWFAFSVHGKLYLFLRLRSSLSSHVTENCKRRAWLSRQPIQKHGYPCIVYTVPHRSIVQWAGTIAVFNPVLKKSTLKFNE